MLSIVIPLLRVADVPVIEPLNVTVWSAFAVNAVEPPVAKVITSEPENVILVFESASPDIESNAILPTFVIFASLISKLPVTSKSPPTLTLPETVKFPPELKDMVSAAAADEAVLKLNIVALLEELKSPSDTASIPAATKMASVPVPSSGAVSYTHLPLPTPPYV